MGVTPTRVAEVAAAVSLFPCVYTRRSDNQGCDTPSGAGGAHFCLGANLARREIRVLFEELHNRVPDIVAIEEPAILQSAFIHGIKRLPVGWTPPS